jgi:hypothetical protein
MEGGPRESDDGRKLSPQVLHSSAGLHAGFLQAAAHIVMLPRHAGRGDPTQHQADL